MEYYIQPSATAGRTAKRGANISVIPSLNKIRNGTAERRRMEPRNEIQKKRISRRARF